MLFPFLKPADFLSSGDCRLWLSHFSCIIDTDTSIRGHWKCMIPLMFLCIECIFFAVVRDVLFDRKSKSGFRLENEHILTRLLKSKILNCAQSCTKIPFKIYFSIILANWARKNQFGRTSKFGAVLHTVTPQKSKFQISIQKVPWLSGYFKDTWKAIFKWCSECGAMHMARH